MATTLASRVGRGIRSPGSWIQLCTSTVIRPPDASAYAAIRSCIQSRAAPMPRSGSS
ncbi:hypothetical protein [Streptomyces cacaoi]